MNRMFGIVYLLLAKNGRTAGELAAHFEVSVRTIYRDVEWLCAEGVPLYMKKGRGGGIYLMPGFTLDKAHMSAQDREDILGAVEGLLAAGAASDRQSVQRLCALLGGKDRLPWVDVDFSDYGAQQERLFSTLRDAIRERRAVEFFHLLLMPQRSSMAALVMHAMKTQGPMRKCMA